MYKNGKKLRYGYTTGSCAAAAAKAATLLLLTGEEITEVDLTLPGGESLTLPISFWEKTKDFATCGVRKDSGDDADATDGMEIRATVRRDFSGITIDGGEGIGRVTRPGLDQPIGAAAINRVPREMIESAAGSAMDLTGYDGGLSIVISAPEGKRVAERTFNERLGIVGGISILGTSGIVEPMSEQALIDTIRAEIKMRAAEGEKALLLTPGNYGEEFIREKLALSLDRCVKCSNFIGEAVDFAVEFGFTEVFLVGHIGKLVKLGSGIMNTHSRNADGRLETLAACALRAGCDGDFARRILSCNTTEDATEILQKSEFSAGTMEELLKRIEDALTRRSMNRLTFGIVVFSRQSGLIAKNQRAKEWDSWCISSERVPERRI